MHLITRDFAVWVSLASTIMSSRIEFSKSCMLLNSPVGSAMVVPNLLIVSRIVFINSGVQPFPFLHRQKYLWTFNPCNLS